jgi:hypothetical protein
MDHRYSESTRLAQSGDRELTELRAINKELMEALEITTKMLVERGCNGRAGVIFANNVLARARGEKKET